MVAFIPRLADLLDLFTKSISSKPLVFSDTNRDKLRNKNKKVTKIMNALRLPWWTIVCRLSQNLVLFIKYFNFILYTYILLSLNNLYIRFWKMPDTLIYSNINLKSYLSYRICHASDASIWSHIWHTKSVMDIHEIVKAF